MKNKFKISSIIIAKNEEKNIARCVESQLKCVDEIIVIVDSSTTDRTLEILNGYEKVSSELADWQGYAATKKLAVSKTSYDWILWIDADEEITPELESELIRFKSTEATHSAYKIARRAYFLTKWIKHGGWYPGFVTRLFNKRFAHFNDNDVHEGLIVDGTTGRLENDLNHYTDPSIFHYYEKFNKYTSLAADELAGHGKTAGLSDLLLRPLFLFVKMYFIRLGFLDGIPGFILAVFSANYVLTKYSKLWEKNKSIVS